MGLSDLPVSAMMFFAPGLRGSKELTKVKSCPAAAIAAVRLGAPLFAMIYAAYQLIPTMSRTGHYE
jgi:hypothetical protein